MKSEKKQSFQRQRKFKKEVQMFKRGGGELTNLQTLIILILPPPSGNKFCSLRLFKTDDDQTVKFVHENRKCLLALAIDTLSSVRRRTTLWRHPITTTTTSAAAQQQQQQQLRPTSD
jgi:hypothetical protein